MFDYKRIDFGKIANKAMKPIAPKKKKKCGPSNPKKEDTPHPNTGVVVPGRIPFLKLPNAEVDKGSNMTGKEQKSEV